MKISKLILFSITMIMTMIFLSSCASYFKRKECEKTNWFEYGRGVALRGQRLNADSFINECKRVESEIQHQQLDLGFKSGMATYCKPEQAFITGKSGQNFNGDMCDYNKLKVLKKRHHEGVLAFCQPKSGYRHGAAGKTYNGICPKNLESPFLANFNRGRKKFLMTEIRNNKEEINDIYRQISQKKRERDRLTYQLNRLPNNKIVKRTRVKDPYSGNYREETKVEEDPKITRERNSISSRISSINSSIRGLETQQQSLRDRIRSHRTELNTLDDSES